MGSNALIKMLRGANQIEFVIVARIAAVHFYCSDCEHSPRMTAV